MKLAASLFAVLLTLIPVAKAGLCDPENVPAVYAQNPDRQYKLTQVSAVASGNGSAASGARVSLKGDIQIIDGCTFRVNNFTFTNGPAECRWYGLLDDTKGRTVPGSNEMAMKVSDADVISKVGNASVEYPLTAGVGREVSFYEFNVLRLYCESTKTVLGQVVLANSSSLVGATGTPESKKVTNAGFALGANVVSFCLIGLVMVAFF